MSPLKTDERSLRIYALHEAGHAMALFVAAQRFGLNGSEIILGMKVDKAGDGFLIDFVGCQKDECRALLTCSNAWIDQLNLKGDASIGNKKRLAELLEMHSIALLAGPLAEAAGQWGFDGYLDVDMRSSWSDLNEYNNGSRKIASLQLPYSVFFPRSWVEMRKDAHTLVGKNWSAIEAIASYLLAKGELSGEEAFQIYSAFGMKAAA